MILILTRKPSCRWQTRATLAKSLHGLRKSSGVVSCIASLPVDSVPVVSYCVLYSNCVCKMHRFGDTRLLKLPWPWNPGQGSLKVIETDTIRKLAYGFLLPPHSNFVSKMHRFRDMMTYWSKIAEKPKPPSFGTFLWGDPLRIFRWLIPSQKLEWWGYQMVYISRSCFWSARHNTGVWRTDGLTTDRPTRRCRKDPR